VKKNLALEQIEKIKKIKFFQVFQKTALLLLKKRDSLKKDHLQKMKIKSFFNRLCSKKSQNLANSQKL
jgi:hypothetical protein